MIGGGVDRNAQQDLRAQFDVPVCRGNHEREMIDWKINLRSIQCNMMTMKGSEELDKKQTEGRTE